VDLWERPLDEGWFDPKTYRPDTRTFDRSAVQRAAQLLVGAKRPAIFAGAGVGVAGGEDHLKSLAELLSARVATTPRGKGLYAEDHPLSLGVMGFAGHAAARDALLGKEVDVLLTVGTSLNETATLNWTPALRKNRVFIQNDIDADRIGRNYPVDVPLVGDAQTVLVELVYHVHRMMREGARPASTWDAKTQAPRVYLDAALRDSDQVPLTPQRWRKDFQEVLPDDAIVFSDIGGHMLSNIHYLTIKEGQRFVLNLGFGSMGHGTVAPIGAALAMPRRPVFAIVGDGCFTMNGMELLTAAEHGIPRLVWIVENNNMHGITYHGSRLVGSRVPLASVKYKRSLEIASMARAMGLAAWVVDKPNQMQETVQQALGTLGPSLIEVRTDPNIPPPLGDRAKSIAGFVES
jgi:acetolactate synthase-1/2/3 large subunit